MTDTEPTHDTTGPDPHVPHFTLLGQFTVTFAGGTVDVGRPTAQAVLVALLQPPNTRRLVDHLVNTVWGTADGGSADSVWHYISRLRRALRPTGLTITGCRPGWRIDVPAAAVDALRFENLVTTARALQGSDPDQAAQRLRHALDLWQGPTALAGLTQPGMRRIAHRLEARRLDAEEDLAELDVARGDAARVLDRLRVLVTEHPGRIRLLAVLIRALHATGRGDEALVLYERVEDAARRTGRPVHQSLIQAAADLRSRRASRSARPVSAAPFQLPADTAHFTGRTAEVERLLARWPADDAAPRTLVVSALDGMGGVGKTALAVHTGHRLAHRFPDGALFVDLHGFTPDAAPTTPDTALNTLLRGLGVSGQQIPPTLDARAALYRSVLAGRMVLVVLDNAVSEAQIRPLLPGTPGCLVLITSRRRMAGLDEADHLDLGILSPTDAARLFRLVAGDRITSADEEQIGSIVAACGHLPLAIRIAAARLRLSRALTPSELLVELRSEKGSLDALDDGERSVGTAFNTSYQRLTATEQRAFRLLGRHPGRDLDAGAAAALCDMTRAGAQRLLDDLEAASLIESRVGSGGAARYSQHDLLRHHASTLAQHGDNLSDVDAAVDRLIDYYVDTAARAASAAPADTGDEVPVKPRSAGQDFSDPMAAEGWLDRELDNLVAAGTLAAARGSHQQVGDLSTVLRHHLHARGRYADAEQLHRDALAAARETGDRHAEMDALDRVGDIHRLSGRFTTAAEHFGQALEIAESVDSQVGRQRALVGLGDTDRHLGRHTEAADRFQQAHDIALSIGSTAGVLRALAGLGGVRAETGRYDDAIQYFDEVHRHSVAAGDHSAEMQALRSLGDTHELQGKHETATTYYREALDLALATGDRNGEYEAHLGLGRSRLGTGEHDASLTHHRTALALATELGQPGDEARAHNGLAHTCRAMGNEPEARSHWQHAFTLLTRLGISNAYETSVDEIRTRLAESDDEAGEH